MAVPPAEFWSGLLHRTLAAYAEPLLRQVAAKLVKPRNQWPAEDLINRGVDVATNPAVLDRRLKELEPAARQLLALIGHSRQPVWDLGNLVELMIALGHDDGLKPVFDLLSAGLLYPYFTPPDEKSAKRVQTFEQWLGFAGPKGLTVFTLPLIAGRAVGEELPLPGWGVGSGVCGEKTDRARAHPTPHTPHPTQEADG